MISSNRRELEKYRRTQEYRRVTILPQHDPSHFRSTLKRYFELIFERKGKGGFSIETLHRDTLVGHAMMEDIYYPEGLRSVRDVNGITPMQGLSYEGIRRENEGLWRTMVRKRKQ